MKLTKTQAVLLMYETFMTKGHLSKADFMERLEANDLKFIRYISELRCYFMNFEVPYEIVYNKKANEYRLISVSEEMRSSFKK